MSSIETLQKLNQNPPNFLDSKCIHKFWEVSDGAQELRDWLDSLLIKSEANELNLILTKLEFLLRKQYSSFAASRDKLTCPLEVVLDDILTELVPQASSTHLSMFSKSLKILS